MKNTPEHQLAQKIIHETKKQGLDLSNDTLLSTLTKNIIEAALEEELTDHLGYEKHTQNTQETASNNARNGYRTKTLLTDTIGPITINEAYSKVIRRPRLAVKLLHLPL